MKLIIAGGREYILGHEEIVWLRDIHWGAGPVTEVVSGTATGVDTCGEMWAKMYRTPVKRFPADWKKWREAGNPGAAGPERNQAMADYADALALFPGGRGSADMRRKAEAGGLKVFVYGEGE